MNYGNICTGLEVLSRRSSAAAGHPEQLLSPCSVVAACMTCGNTKVLRAVHSLLSALMSLFPTRAQYVASTPLSLFSFRLAGWASRAYY